MGDVIRRSASADDIVDDVRATQANASARGGKWKAIADARLQQVLTIIDVLQQRKKADDDVLRVCGASLDAGDERADLFLGRLSDNIWNDVGRPAQEPVKPGTP